jgi:hypothetical protein
LHLVGYLYYWQMGFNSVFKGLREACGKMSRKQTKRRLLNRPVILHLNLSDDVE